MQKTIRITAIIIILSIIINLILSMNSRVFATQVVSGEINQIDDSRYPGIKAMIQSLQEKYPNWHFKLLYTGLSWTEVVANEYTGHGTSPKNLVYKAANYQGQWICSICGEAGYDNGGWRCASEQAIKYMMDPRNSINESDVFQFEELTYVDCNIASLQAMTNGTFLAGHEQGILDAAKNNGVNAYYIVARLIQEQGKDGTVLATGAGYNGQNAGYFNAFNIAASGNSTEEILTNALAYAKKQGWNSLDKSINGGISFLATQYIQKGQNTLYLQKFDVEETNGLYSNQYMQNILAAQNEGTTLRKTYEGMNAVSASHTFVIPVFENMPESKCSRPDTGIANTSSTDYVKVNVNSSIRLRDSANGATTVDWLYKNEIVTRLEKATEKVNGTYWDKVQKSNGSVGYVARETYDNESEYKLYLIPMNQTNNNENASINNATKVKIDDTNNIIFVTPDAIAQDILDAFNGEIKIVRADGNFLSGAPESMATGYVVDDKYTVIKKGDTNGDGKVSSADLLKIQKHLLNVNVITDEDIIKAADVTDDEKISSADLLKIQKHLLNVIKINV